MERHKRLGIARPYARALFELAVERGERESWDRALQALRLLAADPLFPRVLHHPRLSGARLLEFCRAVCGPFLETNVQRDFLTLLVQSGRLECALEICELYFELCRTADEVAAVTVTSAYPLQKAQRRQLEGWLKRYLKRRPELTVSVDKSLLGGLLVRTGDRVIDATVRGRLRDLSRYVTVEAARA